MLKQPPLSIQRSGFTLVEMAVVMVIMGLVMLTVFPALTAVRSASQTSLTQSNLHNLMLATAAYVQANGCLPCPANAAGSGSSFGSMGYASTGVACGANTNTCLTLEGIAPFMALGIPASAARDGWGHWITMRVDPTLTTIPTSPTSVFVPPTSLCSAGDAAANYCLATQVGTSSKGLCAANLPKTKSIMVTTASGGTQYAAVIFVSHGHDGYGSYFAQAAANANNGFPLPFPDNYPNCSAQGGYAQCNAAGGDTQFYDAPISLNDSDPYDDVLLYASRNTVVGMLGNGACNTSW